MNLSMERVDSLKPTVSYPNEFIDVSTAIRNNISKLYKVKSPPSHLEAQGRILRKSSVMKWPDEKLDDLHHELLEYEQTLNTNSTNNSPPRHLFRKKSAMH